MMLIAQTTIPAASLPVEGLKDHLRLGTGFDDSGVQDDVLISHLQSAMAAIEARTGKVMLSRSFKWEITGWRALGEQAMPMAPVTEITRVALADRAEVVTEIDPARYVLQRDNQRPKIVATGACLPTVPLGGKAEIDFVAGYGDDWLDMPADLSHAVFLLAAHFYEHRHEGGDNRGTMPFGVSSLIEPYRTVRILGGGAI